MTTDVQESDSRRLNLGRADLIVMATGSLLWLWVAVLVLVQVRWGASRSLTLLTAGAVGLALVTYVKRRWIARHRVILIGSFVCLMAIGMVTWRIVPLQTDPLVVLAPSNPMIEATVMVTSAPERRSGRVSGPHRLDDSWRARATILSWSPLGLASQSASLPIELDLRRDPAVLVPGTVIHVMGRVRSGDPLRGIAAYMTADSVRPVGDPPWWQNLAAAVRRSAAGSVRSQSPDVRGLLPGLVVGQTSDMPDDLVTAMRDSGLSHLAAVSGGNISIVLMVWLAVLRLSGVRRGRLQLLLLAIAVVAYVVVVQPQPSVDRAAVMALAVLGSRALGWQLRPLAVLMGTVCALVLVDPFLAVSPGFAMSVLATAALCMIATRRIYRHDVDRRRVRYLLDTAGSIAVCAFAATVLVAPVSVSFGNGLQVGGIVANLLAEPCVLPATVSGLLAAVAGLVSPQLAAIVVLPGCWATAWIAGVARWIAHSFPPTPWAGGVQGAALMLILVCSGGAALVFAPTPRVRRLCFGIIAVGLLLLMAVPTPIGTPLTLSTSWPPAGWQVIMCDVGQGDSLLIRVDQTSAVAVDTGPDPTAESRCLHRAGISNIPLVILTHFHADHVEGLPGLMSVAHPALVLESPLAEPVGEAHRVHLWAHDAGMHERPAAPGDVFQVGPVRMRVVWPRRILRGVGSDPNNASVTIVATVSGIRLLLGGDLETAAQQEVLASGEVGSVDVVKVPHHGSAKQSPEWAELTRPKIALIGVGLNNDYGHPWPGTVAAYQRIGSAVGRTDLDGDLAVLRDQNGQLQLLHRSSWG